jgi:hypothetical protein
VPSTVTVSGAWQGIWWNSPAGSESGWGIDFNHQDDTIFATWFTFDLDGKPLWLVVGLAQSAPNAYTGTLYTGNRLPMNGRICDRRDGVSGTSSRCLRDLWAT